MVVSQKLITRYGELKQSVPDCLLLMQVGAFMQVMDEDALEQAGHIIEYLPPYSPELNPIEHKWAQAKAVRKQKKCSVEELFKYYVS